MEGLCKTLVNHRCRTKTCTVCGNDFSYLIGRGNDRKICSTACRSKSKLRLREALKVNATECSTAGCRMPAVRVGKDLCEGCYCRLRRTGTTEKRRREPTYRYQTSAGYIKILLPGHPLADSSGHVFEHRKVLFEVLGPGEQSCFWCDKVLPWPAVVVDHLNENKDDNTKENLVASCNNCNRARGAMLPFQRRMRKEAIPVFIDTMLRLKESHDADS